MREFARVHRSASRVAGVANCRGHSHPCLPASSRRPTAQSPCPHERSQRDQRTRRLSAKFAEEVGKVNEDIKEELPPPAHRPAIGDGASASAEPSQHADRWDYDRMRRLAVVSPRGATLEAFLVLESTIFEAAQSWGVDSRSYNQRSARQALRALELPPQLARPIQRLIDLRNEAVHARELRGHAGSCYRLHRRRSRRS